MDLLFTPADILIPESAHMEKWSVIACDQYTSQPEYWERVNAFVGDAPSALRMIFPEVYLGQDDDARIAAINSTMADYLNRGLFRECPASFLYVERQMGDGSIRRGLVGKLDLEAYDYRAGSASPIRPTEGTVESRLPPRVRIRENAPLELPHVLALIDDPAKTVIEPVTAQADEYETLYDFDLFEGGHIRGRLIPEAATKPVCAALSALFSQANAPGGVAIPVGDGNHSLATAKACFEKLKAALPQEQWETHPARWALVELVNLHDPALRFEPVHRVVFDTDPKGLLNALAAAFPAGDAPFVMECVVEGEPCRLSLGFPAGLLPVGPLQHFLDRWLETHPGTLDYIHDDDALRQLASKPGAVGFLLPPMDKSALVPTVRESGPLPRKTFSLGHSREKRYYLEARKIIR